MTTKKFELFEDGVKVWSKILDLSVPAPPPEPPPPPPPPKPPVVDGIIVPWNITSTMPESRVNFAAGQTKTWIARIAKNVRGFDFIYYIMADFTITAKMQFPLKSDGKEYSLMAGVKERLATGLRATYESAITLRIWTPSLGQAVILDPVIYPGDFIITLTADRAGWGFLNTTLYE